MEKFLGAPSNVRFAPLVNRRESDNFSRSKKIPLGFRGTLDASAFNSSVEEPLTVTYTYPTNVAVGRWTPPYIDEPGPNFLAAFGPLQTITLQIGPQVVTGSGGGILVVNNFTISAHWLTLEFDFYVVRPSTVVGQLFGFDVNVD